MPLNDDDLISQYGNRQRPADRGPFKRQPLAGRPGLSAIHGLVAPEHAHRMVVPGHSDVRGAMVRMTTVGQLRQAGFDVHADPKASFPLHVLITRDSGWDEKAADLFDSCFSENLLSQRSHQEPDGEE